MARPAVETHPVAYRRPSRRLQWTTVAVGFLFFVSLLLEAALLVLGSMGSATSIYLMTGGARDQMMVLIGAAVALVLGGLTLFFSAACAGRYRFTVKLAAILLFLGALLRLAWPMAMEAGVRTGLFGMGEVLGVQVFGFDDPLISHSMFPYLPWFAMGPALLLTLLGLLGLILIAPKRVPVDEAVVRSDTSTRTDADTRSGDRTDLDRSADPYATTARADDSGPARVDDTVRDREMPPGDR